MADSVHKMGRLVSKNEPCQFQRRDPLSMFVHLRRVFLKIDSLSNCVECLSVTNFALSNLTWYMWLGPTSLSPYKQIIDSSEKSASIDVSR